MTSVQIPGVGAITVNAYQWNRPSSVTLPGGTTRTYAYDPLMRMKQITSTDPGANVLMQYQYDYDRMDNITAKATEHGPYAYDYDELYRLTASDNAEAEDETFTYDPVGNRLTSAPTAGPWDYNANNELGGYDAVAFAYDDNGNMVSKTAGSVVTNFIYNVEDRLAQVEDNAGNVAGNYYYDPYGRRLWKEVDGVRTYFIYSDEGLIGEYDALGAEIKSYGWKPGSTWSTDPHFLKENGQYYFYHNDHLGTPQQLTAVSGAVVWKAMYNAFGEASVDPASTVQSNLRFAGQYFDSETGLHYNYHRYYDPATGRYLTPDPIGLAGMDPNLYGYVLNNPINGIDPLGLTKEQVARMLQLARDTQNDLDVPSKIGVAYWFGGRDTAVTNPITRNITISKYYLQDLDCEGMRSLLRLIIHESIHRTRPRSDMIKRPFTHPDIYDEAESRTKQLKDKISELCECK